MGTKYSSNSASGYNATPPADDGTVSEANKGKWSTIKTKLSDPIKTLAEAINTDLVTHFDNGPVAYTSNQTLGAANNGQIIQASGSGTTLTLSDAATLGAGWNCEIISTDTTNTVTIARATASDTVNETTANVSLLPLQSVKAVVNAAANGFLVNSQRRTDKINRISEELSLSNVLTTSKSLWMAEGANVTAASDCNIWTTDGNTVHLVGTTAVTDWGTAPQAGAWKWVICDEATPLTYSATTNKLNTNGADYTCVAGDRLMVYADSASTYVVTIFPFDGSPVVGDSEKLTSGTVIATTSGTSHDFTGIPAGTKRITLGVTGLSTNSTSIIMFQIGDSGGIETTGYAGNVMGTNGYTTPVNLGVVGSGFQIYDSNAGTFIFTGVAILTLVDSATNTWAMHGTFARTETAAGIGIVAGSKSLTGTLDRVRLTTVNGSDTFDAGKFNILYE